LLGRVCRALEGPSRGAVGVRDPCAVRPRSDASAWTVRCLLLLVGGRRSTHDHAQPL